MRTIPYIFVCAFVMACSPPTPAPTCGPLTCAGCCSSSGLCELGLTTASCGRGGQTCSPCGSGQSCGSGICSFDNSGGGGGTTGGGTGGGTTGGGTGGGTTGGGTGGGTTGGGTGGGTTGGGTGGGTTGGGTGGGTTGGGTGGGTTGGGTGGGATGGGGGSFGTCATNCTTQPPPRCLNQNTAVTSAAQGTCVNAQCSYAETQTACPYGCVGTTCAGPSTCTPNARRCNGTQIQTCNSNGSAWLFAQNCSGTCTAGLCDAPCTANERRCNGTTLETCNSGGTAWTTTMACASGCLTGACLTNELDVNGVTVMMEGEYHYTTRVIVRNGGVIQVPAGRKLTLYAPAITIDVASSITGSSSGGTCVAPPDDVEQGIRLIANTVTINGTLSWSSSSCNKHGLVVRAGLIDGPGTVSTTGTARNQLLYGAGGVAPGLVATGSVRSLMPPAEITSSNYPAGQTYNDDGPPALFTWSKPANTITGYYYVVGAASTVPTATSTFIGNEALALTTRPPVGRTFVDVVSIDTMGVVGTVPHEFEINVVDQPPALSSSTNPVPGTYSTNPTVVVAWTGGNPTVGYYQTFDRYPSTRPTPQTGTFQATNMSPAQVLFQNVQPGRWWFHMVALDSMGYSTRRAAHYEVDIGAVPTTGTIAGTVKDSFDAGIVGASVVVQRGLYSATTVAGGVYTFNNTLPEGTYEVVAKMPDAGLQAQSMTLSVVASTTTEGYFTLQPGSGCPTCSDLCSGVACTNQPICGTQSTSGTCNAGVCMGDALPASVLSLGVNAGTTVGRTNSYVIRYSTTNYNPGPDMAYAFTAPTSRSYTIAVARTSGSTSMEWYMTTQGAQLCTGTITYVSPWWDSMPGSQTVSLTAGQTIYLIVDGPTATDTGAYTITVT